MTDNKTLQGVPDVLAETGIPIQIDVQPRNRIHAWLQRKRFTQKYFPLKRTFLLRPLTLGTMQRISGLFLQIDENVLTVDAVRKDRVIDTGHKAIAGHTDTVAKILAAALHNRQSPVPDELVAFMKYNLNAQESYTLLEVVLSTINIGNFLHTIISMRGLNVLESAGQKTDIPSEVSPQVPGNLPEM